MKEFFTTGEVARICGISPRSVVNYCEQGKLGVQKSPVTNYRRIPRETLIEFMEAHGLPSAGLARFESRTVLIADDDPGVLKFIQTLLSRCAPGIELLAVTNGYDALIQTGVARPDLLVLDVYMPRIDGFEVCRRLKQSRETRHVKIIVISGGGDPNLAQKVRESGGDSFLPKPLDPREFLKEVTRLIGVQPAAVP